MDNKDSISYAFQALGLTNKDFVKDLVDYYINKLNNF